MNMFNIYLTGVGGQGIGLLSETLLRAIDYAEMTVKGVDTHGLAQRGGIVISQIRMGEKVFTPIIPEGEADLVIALERHEALRGMNFALKDNGILVYYDTVWQPLPVRLNQTPQVSLKQIESTCTKRGIKEIRIKYDGLPDPRMQNMVLLGAINYHNVIPLVSTKHYQSAMKDLMAGKMLKENLNIFEKASVSAPFLIN